VITNDNNALSPAVVRENQRMWAERDGSDEYIARLKRDRPEENRDIEPYARTRRRIIGELAPRLAAPDADRLALATAGLTRPAIAAALERFHATGELPRPPAHSWCRNPETGEYCERLIDPYETARRMSTHGFRVAVRHGFTRLPFRLYDLAHVPALSRPIFARRGMFVLVAEKR
jgi:hypothetical protein